MIRPGDRREHPTESQLQVDCLEDPDIQTRITVFRDLVTSCRGPQGKAKVIQNTVGGHVTWTKISSRLFSAMSFSTPVLKVMISAFQGHLERFKDGGLLTADFCLSLVESSLKLTLHRRLLIELYEKFALIIDEYLNLDECGCKFDVDVFNLHHSMTLLRSLCGPKLSYLSLDVQKKMCALFLDVFLSTIPLQRQDFVSDRVYIKCFENTDIFESTCLKGVLIECPELSSIIEQKVKTRIVPDADGVHKIRVVLVTESMSGDSESFLDAVYELRENVDANTAVVDKLLALCEEVVKAGVGLLLSQRVIHPKVKVFLREAAVVFVDRLGSLPMPYIRDLTGALPLSVMSVRLDETWCGFGWLDGVTHQIWSDRSYLLLKRPDQPVATLVLKSSMEESLQDLKILSQSAVFMLQLLLKEPYVLSGGGCWMTHVGAYLMVKVKENMSSLRQEFDCSETELITSAKNFVHCFQSLGTGTSDTKYHLTDMKHHHMWSSDNSVYHMTGDTISEPRNPEFGTCNCGILNSDTVEKFEYISENICAEFGCDLGDRDPDPEKGFPHVVDAVCVVRHAVKMAVVTACTVLGICQYIHDSN